MNGLFAVHLQILAKFMDSPNTTSICKKFFGHPLAIGRTNRKGKGVDKVISKNYKINNSQDRQVQTVSSTKIVCKTIKLTLPNIQSKQLIR